MNHSYWLIVIFVATIVSNTYSRPQDFDVKNVYPVYRPAKELDLSKTNSSVTEDSSKPVVPPTKAEENHKNDKTPTSESQSKPKPGIESIATVARASNDGPLLSPSVAMVADQLIDSVGQMVDSDTRTPPKLKEIIKEKTAEPVKKEEKKEASVKEEKTDPQPPVTVRTQVVVDKIEANGKFELPDANERPTGLSLDSSEGKATHTKKKEDEGQKGVAVPVIMDEGDVEVTQPPKKMQKIPDVPKPVKEEKEKTKEKEEKKEAEKEKDKDKKKTLVTKSNRDNPTTTPSSGLSTWILLSDNREATTPSTKKSNKIDKVGEQEKKKVTTTKKPSKVSVTTSKPTKDDKTKSNETTKQTVQSTKKTNATKPVSTVNKEPVSALEAMVKNQKKGSTTKTKTEESKLTSEKKTSDTKKKPDQLSERIDTAETKDKVEIELLDGKKVVTLPPVLMVTTDDPTAITTTDPASAGSATESSVETTTKKKKTSNKKKKKNKNRRRKPASKNETEVELKNSVKNPKQPVGAQLYNFLSREIMPTVGLGLVGVLVTAGLAGLLGYNPFVSGNLPIRRTYESQHGYSPNNYYTYNTDYNDGGQSEEVLFREVLSGMPEDSRYGVTNTENTYPEAQLYNSQEQAYDALKNPAVDAAYPNADDSTYSSTYHDKQDTKYDKDSSSNYHYPQEYSNVYGPAYNAQQNKYNSDNTDPSQKYPVYNAQTGTSYVYPETSGGGSSEKTSRLGDEYGKDTEASKYKSYEVTGAEAVGAEASKYSSEKLSAKYSKTEKIERQPEALYRVAADSEPAYKEGDATVQGVSSQNSWHRIGSPMDYRQLPHLEPGPRSLDLTKIESAKPKDEKKSEEVKKRSKRNADGVIQRIARKRSDRSENNLPSNPETDFENEIDFDDHFSSSQKQEQQQGTEVSVSTEASTTSTELPESPTVPEISESTAFEVSPTEDGKEVTPTTTGTPMTSSTTEGVKESESVSPDTESHEPVTEEFEEDMVPASEPLTFLDMLKRLANFKLRLGLKFLKSTTDAFSKYLDDIQKKVNENANQSKSPSWGSALFRSLTKRRTKDTEEENSSIERTKRSVLDDNEYLGNKLKLGDMSSMRFRRSSEKDKKLSKTTLLKKKKSKKYKRTD